MMAGTTVSSLATITSIVSSIALAPPVIKDLAGSEVMQGCSAWVNFSGVGVVVIVDSFNVSSLTDNGVGDYSINFTSIMTTKNYSLAGNAQTPIASIPALVDMQEPPSTSGTKSLTNCRVNTVSANSMNNRTMLDAAYIDVIFTGGQA